MNARMKIKDFFKAHPVFRYEEFQSFMHARGVTQDPSIRQLLSYYCQKDLIIRIRRSLYAANPELTTSKTIDPYLIAAYATPQAILAYHTALELHNLAYTTFTELTYLVSTHVSDFTFQGQHYRPTRYPKALVEQKQREYGIEILEREGLPIRLTSLERTLVDVLDRPDLAGGWEEIIRSLDHLVQFNHQVVVDYALLLKKASTIAKVGYFLERLPDYLSVDDRTLNQLLPHIPKQPYYLDPKRRASEEGTYIAKWQLIVPNTIIQRCWEEQHADDI